MRINQNTAAFNSYRNPSQTNTVMGKSLEKSVELVVEVPAGGLDVAG